MTRDAAIQTLWAELIAATLADAGIATCVVSPGSRSTPLVAALAADEPRLELVDDHRRARRRVLRARRRARDRRARARWCARAARAAAHYLPALVEASLAGVPLS